MSKTPIIHPHKSGTYITHTYVHTYLEVACPTLPRTGCLDRYPAISDQINLGVPTTHHIPTYIHTYVSFLYCFHIIALHAVNARTVVQTLGTTRQVSFHCTTICQCHCTTHRQVLYGLLLCHSWHSSSSSSCSYSSSCPLGIVLVLRIDSQHASQAPLKTRMIS